MATITFQGTPGSANGFDNSFVRIQRTKVEAADNSGIRGTREWFRNSTNLVRSLTALQILTSEFTQPHYNKTVVAMELVNEPFPYTDAELAFMQSYYQQAYVTLQPAIRSDQIVVALDDGYRGLNLWEDFMRPSDYMNVAMDTVRPAVCDTNAN